ncbi:hypothetical protein [Nonomuraea insulae]|uniref:Uncharacterized protein n=1 Tax=Nonomuraea insulae TaxID=1616787 RepID=A0ABW1CMU9_9ACTN
MRVCSRVSAYAIAVGRDHLLLTQLSESAAVFTHLPGGGVVGLELIGA